MGEGWLEFRPEFGYLALLTLIMQVLSSSFSLFQIIIGMLLPHLQPVIKTCPMPSLSPPPSMSWTKNTPVIIPGTVFVGGLGREVGEEQLEEIFSMLGKVEKVVVVMEKDGGYGFVTFQDYMVLRKVEQEEIIVGGRLLWTAQAVGMVPVTVSGS